MSRCRAKLPVVSATPLTPRSTDCESPPSKGFPAAKSLEHLPGAASGLDAEPHHEPSPREHKNLKPAIVFSWQVGSEARYRFIERGYRVHHSLRDAALSAFQRELGT